ncbi:probable disease resistance RPP8-like protein 2 [Rhododendron vialii]|uniref:probable disease resistance RPP8-like protein 2 n=1 Tax=Rhododendron vialii TaxID=182163 RepID=UPI00266046B0|nr:probable disease resistance RPP8-like protein 2 [Rhododendron vialii]
MHAIMDWILADDHQLIVSIVGVKGTGKSTLARLVYNHQTLSTRRANEILREIQEKVRSVELVPCNEITEETIQGGTVHSTEGRYIIVFNGVYSIEFRDLMEMAFPDTSQGSRIIVTTNNICAAPRAGPNKFTLKLALLTDDHSWELFTCTLGMCVLPKSDLMKLRRKILRTCGGLPLSIMELGRQLSSAEPTSEARSRVIESFNGQQKPWLDLSVISDFPLNLRRCLQYFEKFLAEFEIPVRRLITLWVAEGLVRGGRDHPKYIAKRILAELTDRNMVQVIERKLTGEVKTCCMPPALRKLNLKDEIRSSNRPRVTCLADHLDDQDSSYKHIHGDSSNLSDLELRDHYEHTSSFLSFDTREGSKPGEEIGNFLDRCVSSGCFLLLRVLDLERVFRPRLPKEVGELILLHYLGLRWTFLETLPSNNMHHTQIVGMTINASRQLE